jgi:hypothetical protein
MAVFWAIVLMMEAVNTSETSVNFYQTISRYNPEDSHLDTRHRENLKSTSFVCSHTRSGFHLLSVINVKARERM